VTASEFAQIANGTKRGKVWVAKCPVHSPDRKPSLTIGTGRDRSVVFKCQSQGCDKGAIIAALGLTWQDVLGDQVVTEEVRQRLRDEKYLHRLEWRWLGMRMMVAADPAKRRYWEAASRRVDGDIEKLRDKLYPERARRRKMQAAIRRLGWNEIWRRFLLTEKGKAVAEKWSLKIEG
jgi:hypothetical protein